MSNCTSTLERPSMPFDSSRLNHMQSLPQWHIFMCRARWFFTPHPSDAGSAVVESSRNQWVGPAKALLWMVISIGAGLLIASLGG